MCNRVLSQASAMAAEKPKLDLTGLAQDLERCDAVREYLRNDSKPDLFDEATQQNVKDACKPHIHATLKNLITRTVGTDGWPQPPVHPLRDELRLLYQKCGRTPNEGAIVHDSWHIRKFIGMVKMKTRKGKVSQVTQFNYGAMCECG